MGNRKIINFLFCLRTNRARNRAAIRMQIRTRVSNVIFNNTRYITASCHLGYTGTRRVLWVGVPASCGLGPCNTWNTACQRLQ
jgi:hypothetical protein